MQFDWEKFDAAIWRGRSGKLHGVKELDTVALDSLLNIDRQKQELLANTKGFLNGKGYNNALLWGARGTGKSSLIKAVFCTFLGEGLKLLQINKEDLGYLPELIDDLREIPYKFIIFCDDISFESGDNSYIGLKTVLEGSIEKSPKNIVIYATSNRRHLLPEYNSDNEMTVVKEREIHYGDCVEEKISLSDRFGLWLSFYHGSLEEYYTIIRSLFGAREDMDAILREARIFSQLRASRSGRCAKQFYEWYMANLD